MHQKLSRRKAKAFCNFMDKNYNPDRRLGVQDLRSAFLAGWKAKKVSKIQQERTLPQTT